MCVRTPSIPTAAPPPQMQEAKDAAMLDLERQRKTRRDGSVKPMSILTSEGGDTGSTTTGRVNILGG